MLMMTLWTSTSGDAGRPHLESADDAQLGLHQALRGGDEGVGGQAHLNAGTPPLTRTFAFPDHFSLCDKDGEFRTYWMLGCGVKSRGSTWSLSSTARTSWSRCPWRGGSSTRWFIIWKDFRFIFYQCVCRWTGSGETSWQRLCRTPECCRLLVNPICWWETILPDQIRKDTSSWWNQYWKELINDHWM